MKEITLTLTTLAYGGAAMGRYEGKAIFVPFALPGETIRARLVEERKNYARAELLQVLQPAPERIPPRCPHFGQCGGCHYQHLPYPAQLQAKTDILRDQLTRIGKIANPPLRPIVPSPQQWNYRNHIQLHLTAQGEPGYIRANAEEENASPEAVFPLQECHLPEESLANLWQDLHFEAGSPLQRVSLRAGTDQMLILEADSPHIPEVEIEADLSVIHLSAGEPLVLAGDDHLIIEILQRPFRVSAASFFQVNTRMAEAMVEHILSLLPPQPALVYDVYCGAGLFSAFLAPRCQRLIGIEASPSACADFAANLDEFDNVELYEAPAEDALPALPEHPEVILVDPPRAGLHKTALDALAALRPPLLLYISCDPSTLARDAARLIAAGATLEQTTPFDLFPQTYHIESISVFRFGA